MNCRHATPSLQAPIISEKDRQVKTGMINNFIFLRQTASITKLRVTEAVPVSIIAVTRNTEICFALPAYCAKSQKLSPLKKARSKQRAFSPSGYESVLSVQDTPAETTLWADILAKKGDFPPL